MKIEKLANGAIVIEPRIFEDERGYFFESFNEEQFNKETGMDFHPVQDNESESCAGVFRGLHFQKPPYDQAKLVRVVKGMAVDFAVDIRKGSPTYGKWTMCILDDCDHTQFFIPKGFAHGFLALQDDTVFQYKCDNYYNKESEGAITFEDKELKCCDECVANVNKEFTLEKYLSTFPKGRLFDNIILSDKDKSNKKLEEIDNPFVYKKQEPETHAIENIIGTEEEVSKLIEEHIDYYSNSVNILITDNRNVKERVVDEVWCKVATGNLGNIRWYDCDKVRNKFGVKTADFELVVRDVLGDNPGNCCGLPPYTRVFIEQTGNQERFKDLYSYFLSYQNDKCKIYLIKITDK